MSSSCSPPSSSSTSAAQVGGDIERPNALPTIEIAASSTIVSKDDSSNDDTSLSSASSSISDDDDTSAQAQAQAQAQAPSESAALSLPAATKATPPPKPQRPFTEYNIFFQLEREHLLQSMPDDLDGEKQGYTLSGLALNNQTADPAANAALRPVRYRQLILPADWYVVGCKGKRKHRKTHGAVTFVELTKRISKAWASVAADTKTFCGTLAKSELARYRGEMEVYIGKYGAEAAKGKRRKKVEVLAARAAAAKEKQDKLDKKAKQAQAKHNMTMTMNNMHMDMSIGGDGSFVPVDFEIGEVDDASVATSRSPVTAMNMPPAKRQRANNGMSRPLHHSPTGSACYDNNNNNADAVVTPEGTSQSRVSVEEMMIAATQRRRQQLMMQQKQQQALMMHRRRQQQQQLINQQQQQQMAMRNDDDNNSNCHSNSIPTINRQQLMQMHQQQHQRQHKRTHQQSQQRHRQDEYEPPFDEEVDAFLNNFEHLLDNCHNGNNQNQQRGVNDDNEAVRRAPQSHNARPSLSPSLEDGECRNLWENLADDDAKFQSSRMGEVKGMASNEEKFAMIYLKKFHSKCTDGMQNRKIGSKNIVNNVANGMMKQEDCQPPRQLWKPTVAW